jgi:C4-dicarboxylate-specific signal transduction histidine kinase
MDDIIRSLLDYARPAPPRAGPVDVNQAVDNALSLVTVQKWFEGLDLKLEYGESLPPAECESNRLIQVLINLLENAGQAMKGGGALMASTGREGGRVYIQIADDGPGVPPEHLTQVFDPFFTTKPPGKGTGLGLSVSQSIVESYGGAITVENRRPRGCAFTVYLPVAEDKEGDHDL